MYAHTCKICYPLCAHACLRSMHSFNAVSGPLVSDGRGREYGKKAMKGDKGSGKSFIGKVSQFGEVSQL